MAIEICSFLTNKEALGHLCNSHNPKPRKGYSKTLSNRNFEMNMSYVM
jgi:hypothetical protein